MKIFGVFDSGRSDAEIDSTLVKMGSVLGWQISGHFSESCLEHAVGLGCLSPNVGHSLPVGPIWNEEHNLCIVAAGKIFDYEARKKELIRLGHDFRHADSDAEFVLHAFEEWSEKAIGGLNGSFALALYDTRARTLRLVNDRYGMKPMYYCYRKPALTFASEVKGILADDTIAKEIDWEGWRDFFSYGYLLGRKTLFKNIHSLANASILTVTEENMTLRQYWSYAGVKVDHVKSEEYFIDKGTQLIRQAIRRQAADLKECIVLLSGGYDSRCIASGLRYWTDVSFETFTTRNWGALSPWGPGAYLDGVLAREIAKCLGVKNTYVPIPSNLYQRYFVDSVFIADGMWCENLWVLPLVDKLKGPAVNFDGIAGDHLLKGLINAEPWLWALRPDHRELPSELRAYMRRRKMAPEIIAGFFAPEIRAKLQPNSHSIVEELKRIGQHENVVTIFFLTNRTRNAICLNPNNIISAKAETRFPFLDNDLAEFALSIPPIAKTMHEIYVKILRKAFPEIMKIPSVWFRFRHVREYKIRYLFLLVLEKLRYSLIPRISPSRRKIQRATIDYLVDLLDELTVPSYVDVQRVRERAGEYLRDNKDPSPFLAPIAHFCIWYNLFCQSRPGEDCVGALHRLRGSKAASRSMVLQSVPRRSTDLP